MQGKVTPLTPLEQDIVDSESVKKNVVLLDEIEDELEILNGSIHVACLLNESNPNAGFYLSLKKSHKRLTDYINQLTEK